MITKLLVVVKVFFFFASQQKRKPFPAMLKQLNDGEPPPHVLILGQFICWYKKCFYLCVTSMENVAPLNYNHPLVLHLHLRRMHIWHPSLGIIKCSLNIMTVWLRNPAGITT